MLPFLERQLAVMEYIEDHYQPPEDVSLEPVESGLDRQESHLAAQKRRIKETRKQSRRPATLDHPQNRSKRPTTHDLMANVPEYLQDPIARCSASKEV